MKTLFFSLTLVFLFFHTAFAQKFEVGGASSAELSMSSYDRDPSAHAVVLAEQGDARITSTNDDNIRLVYQYHVRIKIFDSDGFKEGTIEIPLYIGKEVDEKVDDIAGITTYIDERGSVKKEELQQDKIYRVAENKNHTTVKFAMPGLRKGCIIDYRYTIISPYVQDFHHWQFQSDIPKVKSEYETHIPGFWTYNASMRGGLKLDKNVAELERECFSSYGSKADCSHLIYGMNNIPAFIEEDYMTSPKNFIAAIYFELMEYSNPYNGVKNKVAQEWKDVDNELKRESYFGLQMKKKDQLKERIMPVIAGKSNDLDKAKAVYSYIQKNMKWDEMISIGSENIRKALDTHTGNSGDINMALVSALMSAGINAEAVLISTRSHGVVNQLYPVITEFNYLLAKANIGGKSYLLDATDPLLSFGMLPMRCLNDQGRVMSLDKPSYWIDIATPNIQSTTSLLNLTLQDDGKLVGTITTYSRGYSAYEKRRAIKKFNSLDEYVENLDEKLSKTKIKKYHIDNVDSLDNPVAEIYDVEIDSYDDLNHTKLTFNPYLWDRITTNPFKLDTRSYPVDWGMPSEARSILNLKLPEGYSIENPPQNTGFALPNKGGSFSVVYNEGQNSFSLSHVMQFNKSIYVSEEYPYLKELYNKIILSEKNEMIFKKKI